MLSIEAALAMMPLLVAVVVVAFMPFTALIGKKFLAVCRLDDRLARKCGFRYVLEFHGSVDCIAFSMWIAGANIVVWNTVAILMMNRNQKRFVAAHELGHLALGHCRKRYLGLMIGRIGFTKQESQRCEAEADNFAFDLTGLTDKCLLDCAADVTDSVDHCLHN